MQTDLLAYLYIYVIRLIIISFIVCLKPFIQVIKKYAKLSIFVQQTVLCTNK